MCEKGFGDDLGRHNRKLTRNKTAIIMQAETSLFFHVEMKINKKRYRFYAFYSL